MAKLPSAFKSDEHQAPAYEPISPGTYIAKIVESEWKDCSPSAKDPNGKYVKLTIRLEPNQEFAGRSIWVNLNLVNKNETAVEIANGELSAVTQACGKKIIQDTEELHGIPFKIKVGVRKDNRGDDYPDTNVIRAYEALEYGDVDEDAEAASTKKKGKAPWD